MIVIKFSFLFKSGKTFDCIEELTQEQVTSAILTAKTCIQEDVSGSLLFEDCCVAMREVAVISWEVLDEQKTEES